MNGNLLSTKSLVKKLYFSFTSFWTPVKCLEENIFNDSHFVAALVFFIATVERSANVLYSLSQFNPVNASNSYQSGMTIITDAFPKTAFGNAIGITPTDTTTVALLIKNQFNNRYIEVSKL